MKINIEIKARAGNLKQIQERAREFSDTHEQVFKQEDTFFQTPVGRLKLRVFSRDMGELISYQRPDQKGPKASKYHVFQTDNPESLKNTLADTLHVRGVVRKTRSLYITGQTRIHLDEVVGLGNFIELEVVLHEGQEEKEGIQIANELMKKLGVSEVDLIDQAYIDLLEGQDSFKRGKPPALPGDQ